jgi:hypothetical protein
MDWRKKLLFEQFITDIVVDANNKWIEPDSGFYSNRQMDKKLNIIYNNNSPLPSNVINDIDINSVTGEVL